MRHFSRATMILLSASLLAGCGGGLGLFKKKEKITVPGERVAVLGAAFKPDSDDVRDSPALWVAGELHLAGAKVSVYDPKANGNAAKRFPTLTYVDSAGDACRDADLVLHLTEWREFRDLDPSKLADVVRHPRVLDGRNVLDAEAWREAGWEFRSMGRR